MPFLKKKKEEPVRELAESAEGIEEIETVKGNIKKPAEATPQIITEEQLIISQLNYLISAIDVVNKKVDYIKAKSDEV